MNLKKKELNFYKLNIIISKIINFHYYIFLLYIFHYLNIKKNIKKLFFFFFFYFLFF